MKTNVALTNCKIYTGKELILNNTVLISGENIVDIVEESHIPEDYEIVDLRGNNICPGLVDLQIYGVGNHLYSAELTKESLENIESELLKQGCTTFCITLATNTLELFKKAITVFKSTKLKACIGLHLEGPFLNAKKRGAHPEELIFKASVDDLKTLFEGADEVVKIMTVAPELFDASCIAFLKEKGVLISAGHSNATKQEADQGFALGIETVTHLWNAMTPLHHREVGLPGAVFDHHAVKASIIVDGIHVDYEAVKLSKKLLGDRLFLITDAVASCREGIYQHILNDDHYVLPDGTLSGSALTMLKAIQNCVEHVGIPLEESIRMATLYPANLIKRTDLGRIESGAKANLLVFDEDFKVDKVFIGGKAVKK